MNFKMLVCGAKYDRKIIDENFAFLLMRKNKILKKIGGGRGMHKMMSEITETFRKMLHSTSDLPEELKDLHQCLNRDMY